MTETAATLDQAIDFDCPFEVHEDGTVTKVTDLYAPEVYYLEDTNNNGDVEVDNDRWYPLYGYSSQHMYRGPIMHPSESVGGRMAQELLDNPGIYVVTTVMCFMDEDDDDYDIAGWIVLELVG